MSANAFTPTNTLRKNVEEALALAPEIDERRIDVAATDGVVTLTGHVPSYTERVAAKRLVKRIFGVHAIANDLEIDLPGDSQRADAEIAEAVLSVLKWNASVPHEMIQPTVHNGWITLEGEVDWQYQRRAAWEAVRPLVGVRGIDNEVLVAPAVKPQQVREKIEAALVRDARRNAKNISVEAKDEKVILRGTVAHGPTGRRPRKRRGPSPASARSTTTSP